ncbi:MAG: DNA (cytosine-5-)-methyltransferase [Planctomycetaceae bacterium]|nr:DNA (cytosine-5-)-methyltransferase [Planctomycetaceae bacterium]
MKYFSVCDGIGAAHAAWIPLGFECVGVSEIDKYCNKLIETKYGFKNYGDLNNWQDWDIKETPDIIIGGTPCQDFSIAGQRLGEDGQRGFLTVEFFRFVSELRPRYFVWENVPGVFSIDKGRFFRKLITTLDECGYGVAWRVLDAQYFGVPQRRRRVFVAGCLGDGRCAGEILFDAENVPRNPETCGKTREKNQGAVAHCLKTSCGNKNDVTKDNYITGTLGTSRGTSPDRVESYCVPIAETITTLNCRNPAKAGNNAGVNNPVLQRQGVRRLMPVECERLQGFPPGFTEGFSDTQRYKMIGNSMAVPVVKWIGKRIIKRNLI